MKTSGRTPPIAQASGLITPNFTIGEAGDVTDNLRGVILVR
jgi:hypothetical protein